MKMAVLFLALLLPGEIPQAQASYYRWTDQQGVTHFTDNPDKIPSRYRKRAREIDLPDSAPATHQAPPPAASPAPGAGQAKPKAAAGFGGHTEGWWRGRFTALREELKKLEEGIPAKETKLAEARRKRVIYTRAQDRVAVNAAQDDLGADRARMDQLRRQLADLEAEAAQAGVPPEWRQ